MPGLVLEGGTFRTLFSCGVLDALLDEKIYFPYTVAVSAGAGYGISYHSMQKGRTNEIMKRFRNDKRYIGSGWILRLPKCPTAMFLLIWKPLKRIPANCSAR